MGVAVGMRKGSHVEPANGATEWTPEINGWRVSAPPPECARPRAQHLPKVSPGQEYQCKPRLAAPEDGRTPTKGVPGGRFSALESEDLQPSTYDHISS